MGKEVEAKYLLFENERDFTTLDFRRLFADRFTLLATVFQRGVNIQQGYLPIDIGLDLAKRFSLNLEFTPVEARLRSQGHDFYFTVKGDGSVERNEEQVQISSADYINFWPQTKGKRISKDRLKVPYGGFVAEIDVYKDRRDLILGEIEVPTRIDLSSLPALGKDVTKDPAYKNRNLAL